MYRDVLHISGGTGILYLMLASMYCTVLYNTDVITSLTKLIVHSPVGK